MLMQAITVFRGWAHSTLLPGGDEEQKSDGSGSGTPEGWVEVNALLSQVKLTSPTRAALR